MSSEQVIWKAESPEVGDYVIPYSEDIPDSCWTPCRVVALHKNGTLRARSDNGNIEHRGPLSEFKIVRTDTAVSPSRRCSPGDGTPTPKGSFDMTPTLGRFDTEEKLMNYLDALNERGVTPEIAVTDSRGHAKLVCLQAPGGDGWGVAYYGVTDGDEGTICGDEDGGWVKPARYLDEWHNSRVGDWQPQWPVFGVIDGSLSIEIG